MPNPVISLDFPDPRVPVIERGLLSQRMFRLIVDIVRRLGGQRADYVQEARSTALEAEAMMAAVAQGAIPEFQTLTPPSGLLSWAATSSSAATVSVAAHARGSTSISAGTVTGVARGSTHYIYYLDPSGSGGSVTFYATTSLTDLSQSGARLVGAINVELAPPASGGVG